MGPFAIAMLVFSLAQIVIGLIQRAKAKKASKADPAPWQDIQSPDGAQIPKVYGSAYLSPLIVWVGDRNVRDLQDGTYEYHAKMQGMVCHGPVDRLYDYIVRDCSLRAAPPMLWAGEGYWPPITWGQNVGVPEWTGARRLPIDRPTNQSRAEFMIWAGKMFGEASDPNSKGGLAGITHFHWGLMADAICELNLEAAQFAGTGPGVQVASAIPGVAYVNFGHLQSPTGWPQFASYAGGVALPGLVWNPPPADLWAPACGGFYWGSDPNVDVLQVLVGCKGEHGFIGGDMNPADIMYDLLTSASAYGCGFDPALVDKTSFDAAALILADEDFGLSVVVSEARAASDYLDDIAWHIDGIVYQAPLTGKLTLTLFRKNYSTSAVPILTPSNARNIVVVRPGLAELISEVKVTYQRMDGLTWHKTEDELFATNPTASFAQPYQVLGRNLGGTLVGDVRANWNAWKPLIHQGATLLVENVDYTINRDTGIVVFMAGGAFQEGEPATATYWSAPSYFGYVDQTQTIQNLATAQLMGEVRTESYDLPYVTNDVNAQRIADRLLRSVSRPLARVSFEMDHTGYSLVPGSVLRLQSPDHGMYGSVLRILSVDYGRLETGTITIDAVEDVYSDQVAMVPVVVGGGGRLPVPTLKAPRPAGMVQVIPSAVRMAIYPADPTLPILMRRTDDVAGLVNPVYFQIAAGVLYYDDPILVGTTKYYWIQHVDPSGIYSSSDWLGPVAATAVAGTPGSNPAVILPIIEQIITETETTGTVEVVITDPHSRVVRVEFRTREGDLTWSPWARDGTVPYSATVNKVALQTSAIEWSVLWYNADPILVTTTRLVEFGPGVRQAIAIEVGTGSLNINEGVQAAIRMPFDGSWVRWTMLAPYDPSPRVTMDIWSDTYGNFPPTVADTITGNEAPKLTGATKNEGTALLNWDRNFKAGDVLYFVATQISACRGWTLVVDYNRNTNT